MTRIVAGDFETTGLRTDKGHRVIDFAFVEIVNRKVTGRVLHHFVDPQFPIDAGATSIHGITNDMLIGKPTFASLIPEIREFIGNDEVIFHNATFDMEHFDNECKIAGIDWRLRQTSSVMCTLKAAWAMDKVEYVKGYKLDDMRKLYRVDQARDLHGALVDASILAEFYIRFSSKWYI